MSACFLFEGATCRIRSRQRRRRAEVVIPCETDAAYLVAHLPVALARK